MNGVRKLLVILISAVMVLTCIPLTAFAENEANANQNAATQTKEATAAQATQSIPEPTGNFKVKSLWASLHEVGQVTFKWTKKSGSSGNWVVKYRMRKIGGDNAWSDWTYQTVKDSGKSENSLLVKIPIDYVIEIHVKGGGDSAYSQGILTCPAGGKYQSMKTVYVKNASTGKRLGSEILLHVGDKLNVRPDYEYPVSDYTKRPRLYPNHMLYGIADKSIVNVTKGDGSAYTGGLIDGNATIVAKKAGKTVVTCRAPNGRTFLLTVNVLNKDDYQIVFKVKGGKWDDGTTADKVMILTGESGAPRKLKASDIPKAGTKPDFGYKSSGKWNTTPSTSTVIKKDTTYIYTYDVKGLRPEVPKITNLTGAATFEGVILRWGAVAVPKNGTTITYEVFVRYKTLKGTEYSAWKKAWTGTATQYTIPLNPLNGCSYEYAVRAYTACGTDCPTGEKQGTIVYGALSDVNSKQPVHPMYISGTIKATTPLYREKSGSASSGTLAKGSFFVGYGGQHTYIDEENKVFRLCVDKGGTTHHIGTRYYVLPSKVGSKKATYTSKDIYTKAEKESFVNTQSLASGTNYLIWVNTYTQHVNLFKRTAKGQPWKLVDTWLCNTGSVSTPTCFGQYTVSSKIRQKENGTEYMTVFNGIGLHLKLSAALGKPVSNGCVRLAYDPAVWVYNNIKKGTKVYIY